MLRNLDCLVLLTIRAISRIILIKFVLSKAEAALEISTHGFKTQRNGHPILFLDMFCHKIDGLVS